MTMKKVQLLFLFVFLGITQEALSQQKTINGQMTFGEAVQIMLTNNHGLKQSEYLLKQKQSETKAAKSYYLPQLGFSGGYMAMQKDLKLDLTPVRDAITPLYSTLAQYGNFSGVPNPDPNTNKVMPVLPDNISTNVVREKMLEGLNKVQSADWEPVLQDKYFGSAMATAQIPLFTGGKIKAANKAASIEEKEAIEQINQKKAELISELAERYFGLKLALEAVTVRQEVYDAMQRHLEEAKKMEQQGLIARAEVLNAQVKFAEADRELKKAKQNAAIIRQALLNSLSLSEESNVVPTTDLFFLKNIESKDFFKNLAMENSPLLLQINTKRELAEQGVAVEKSAWYPTIALQGMYNIAKPNELMPNWVAGVGAKWILFDGFSRKNKIRAATYKIDQVNEAGLKAKNDITTMIDKLYGNLMMYKDQLEALNTAQSFAEEYVRIREKGFKEEMNNTTDVVDARLALSKVKIERLEAMYGFDKTLAELLKFSGMVEKFENYYLQHQIITENN